MRYANFAVRISADGQGGFWATILESPSGGAARESFEPPYPGAQLDPILDGIARTVATSPRGPTRHLECLASAPSGVDPRELGTRLFNALFRGDIRRCFDSSVERVDQTDSPGLCLRLIIDPREPGCAGLAALPWELLYDPSGRGFLGRRQRSPIVRFLEVATPVQRPLGKGPLRVLVVLANAQGLPSLDVEAERRAAEQWGRRSGIDVEVLASATFEDLRRQMRQREVHVLHFTGHGEHRKDGTGQLLFSCSEGGAKPVTGEFLAEQFDAYRSLRLVVLNACYSGYIPRRDGLDPFAGVAAAIVRGGIPAVVAMQFPISDRAATRFACGLYRSLSQGLTVEAAVVEGRRNVAEEAGSGLEWATPALYLRKMDEPVLASRPATGWRRWGLAACVALAGILAAAIIGWRFLVPEGAPRSAVAPQAPLEAPQSPMSAQGCPPPSILPELAFARVEPAEPPSEIERPYCLGVHEVTVDQWRTVMGIDGRADEVADKDLPQQRIRFDQALRFIERLNDLVDGSPFRLPSEAEWLFASLPESAGVRDSEIPGDVTIYANCDSKTGNDGFDRAPAPVGSFLPNQRGLWDMRGNLWEWVDSGTADSEYRRKCGGSFENTPDSSCTLACTEVLGNRGVAANGFRLARDVEPPADRPRGG